VNQAIERFVFVILLWRGWTHAPTRKNGWFDTSYRDPNYVLWEFAIYSELHHHVPYNGNMVRSLFERAVECSR
jgi:hypothetical protein